MCSDDHIYLPFFQIFYGLFLLSRSSKSAQQFHTYRKLLHSLDKGIVYLLGKDRSRSKISHLSALLHFFKRSAQSYLRFAITYITADQSIHDLCALHIPLCILDRTELILCFFIWKHLLEFSLPYCIRATDIAFLLLTHCIKLHQLSGNIFNCTADFTLCFIPLLSAKLIQLRNLRSIRP